VTLSQGHLTKVTQYQLLVKTGAVLSDHQNDALNTEQYCFEVDPKRV